MSESNRPTALSGAREGRLGLALSGGGFRAALFHIGVLASLAEQDLLRHVAVISTVSGGGIIGAFYYLKVRQLLEGSRGDGLQSSAEAFRKIVSEIEQEFLPPLQLNLRLLTFADRHQNARILANEYSSSQRLADLFDQHFFQPLSGTERTLLRDLPIQNQVSGSAVAPALIINATSLNTGHLFQLTGTHIGEVNVASVSGGNPDIPHLPRLDIGDTRLSPIQQHYLNRITLGQAVAASCCVPGLFEPLCLNGLYRDSKGEPVELRLVDGGVFDNQAVVSLLEERCSHVISSDASDRLPWQSHPAEVVHQVALRTNDIMMDRIRSEVLHELKQKNPGEYAILSLGENDNNPIFAEHNPRFFNALRNIRTDLDAFTDLEACSLMYHGFRLCEHQLSAADSEPSPAPGDGRNSPHPWQFLQLEKIAADQVGRDRLLHQLDIGARQFFKVFYLGEPLPWIIMLLPSVIPVGSSALLIYLLPPIPNSAWILLGLALVTIVALVQNARIVQWLDQVAWIRRNRSRLVTALKPIGITMLLGAVGALTSWVNLRIFNRLFLRYGRLRQQD